MKENIYHASKCPRRFGLSRRHGVPNEHVNGVVRRLDGTAVPTSCRRMCPVLVFTKRVLDHLGQAAVSKAGEYFLVGPHSTVTSEHELAEVRVLELAGLINYRVKERPPRCIFW